MVHKSCVTVQCNALVIQCMCKSYCLLIHCIAITQDLYTNAQDLNTITMELQSIL